MSTTKQQTQTTSQTPWAPAQPYLKDTMGKADTLLDTGKGFNFPGFSTTVPFSADTTSALTGLRNFANSGNPLGVASMDATMGMLNGSQGPNTEADYRGLLGRSGNDAWAGAVDNQAGRIADDVNRQFSDMGRYGSAAHTGALVDQIGDFRQGALANQWNQNIANERGILGDISGVQQQGVMNKLGALSAVPGVYQQQTAPYGLLGQVGSAYDDLATRQMQEQLDRFNSGDMADWNRLAAANAIFSGGGALGGTGTTTAQVPTNPFGGALGGAMMGSQIMPGIGTVLGGGLGLLGGLFG